MAVLDMIFEKYTSCFSGTDQIKYKVGMGLKCLDISSNF